MKMFVRILAAAAAAFAAAGPVAAATWKVDPARSHVGFSGTQTGTAFSGRFETFQATIDFDPSKPEDGHALITIDLASVKTGDSQRDEALPGNEWFDVKRFPKARFEVKHFTSKGGNAYEARGTLSLRDISRDVVLPFTLDIKDGEAHAKGHVELLRNDFGVGQNAWSSDAYVGFPVGVDIDLVATPGS